MSEVNVNDHMKMEPKESGLGVSERYTCHALLLLGIGF